MSPTSPAVAAVLDKLPKPQVDRPNLVCIEGLGGAGKSVLAEAITKAYNGGIQLVHGDDFYGPEEGDWRSWTPRQGYERHFDHQRLEHQLLRPLRGGRPARFQRYDWPTNTLDAWLEVEPHGVVLVEGVYLLKRRLRRYWDLAIYVDTPRELRQARLRVRGENDEGWIDKWAAAEDYYERVERPAQAADLVLRGY